MENEDFKHGIVWMDWQHDGLIKEFNALHDACEEGTCALTIMKTSKTIERYMEDHFGLEEAYMKRFAFPDFKRHQREHLAFRQRFKEFGQTGLAGEKKVGGDLLLMLMDWIMKHIQQTDLEVAKFFLRKGVK
jgi:hemerythrin-like metal-binding protein